MSDFKNKLIEKYTEYFILNNPSYNKDDQATIDFCNAKLEQYYAPYISHIVDKKKISNETEELLTSEASLKLDSRRRYMEIFKLCITSIFSERPSLKTYTNELKGFDEIRYYFNLEEFENSIISFLNYDIEINILDLIQVLEQNRNIKLKNTFLKTQKIEQDEIIKDIINLKDKKSYNAKKPRAKKENEIVFENIIKFTTDTFEKSEEEVTESIFKVLKSDVKSKAGMEELKYVLNQIINLQRSINGVSKSNFLKSIQPYIFLLFDNDQYGIKRKETFDALNSKRKEDEYDGDYNRYYNKRIDSLIFKK
jgi:hypothetical protein